MGANLREKLAESTLLRAALSDELATRSRVERECAELKEQLARADEELRSKSPQENSLSTALVNEQSRRISCSKLKPG